MAVTNVAVDPLDPNKVTLSVDLKGKKGEVAVNGVKGKEVNFIAATFTTAEATSSTKVTVTFSGELDKSSAETVANYKLVDQLGNEVSLESAVLAEDKQSVVITLEAGSRMFAVSEYTLEASKVKDVNGNEIAKGEATFAGSEAPSLVKFGTGNGLDNSDEEDDEFDNLADGSTEAAAQLYASFNAPLLSTTITTTSVKLYNKTLGVYVPGTPSYSAVANDGRYSVYFKPTNPLALNNAYELQIADTVASQDGTPIGEALVLPFVVGEAPVLADTAITEYDLELPTGVISTEPQFIVQLDFKPDTDSIDGNVVLQELDDLGNVVGEVESTVDYDSKALQIKLTPNDKLKAETDYRVVVKKGLTNEVKIGLAKDVEGQVFTTDAETTLEIEKVEIAKANSDYEELVDGAVGIKVAGDTVGAADIKVTFKEDLKAFGTGYPKAGKVYLLQETGSKAGQYYKVDYDISGSNAKVLEIQYGQSDVDAQLELGATYKLIISDLVDNTANGNIMEPLELTFTAESANPAVKSVYLGTGRTEADKLTDGAANIVPNVSSDIQILFDKNLEDTFTTSYVKADLVKVYKDGKLDGTATAAVTVINDVITVPASALESGKKYRVLVSKNILAEKVAGQVEQKLGTDFNFNFVTAKATHLVVSGAEYTKWDNSTGTVVTTDEQTLTETGIVNATLDKPLFVKFTMEDDLKIASSSLANVVLKETVSGKVISTTVGLTAAGDTIRVTPKAALTDNTSYTLTVAGVEDTIGNKLKLLKANEKTYVFKTADTVGTTATFSITDGAEVQPTDKFTVKFNKNVGQTAATTVANYELYELDNKGDRTGSAITVKSGVLSYNSTTTTATVDLSKQTDLKQGKSYELTVLDVAGISKDTKVKFAVAADKVAPTIKEVSQGSVASKVVFTSGITNIDLSETITVTFNDLDVNTTATASDYVKVLNTVTGTYEDISKATITLVDGVASADTLTIAGLNQDLAADGKYRLIIAGVEDTATTPNKSATYTVDFLAGPGATITPLTSAGYIANDGTDVKVKPSEWSTTDTTKHLLGVEFGEEINTDDLTAENVYLENTVTGEKVAATISNTFADGKHTVNLVPTEELVYSTKYKAVFSKDIRDVAGNKATNAKNVEIAFTTEADTKTFTFGNLVSTTVLKDSTIKFVSQLGINVDEDTVNATTVTVTDVTDAANPKVVRVLDDMLTVANVSNAGTGTNEKQATISFDTTSLLEVGKYYEIKISGVKSDDATARTVVEKTYTVFVKAGS